MKRKKYRCFEGPFHNKTIELRNMAGNGDTLPFRCNGEIGFYSHEFIYIKIPNRITENTNYGPYQLIWQLQEVYLEIPKFLRRGKD